MINWDNDINKALSQWNEYCKDLDPKPIFCELPDDLKTPMSLVSGTNYKIVSSGTEVSTYAGTY